MINFLEVLGSFATVWIAMWFVCAAVLALVYPLVRSQLLKWHPAIAGNLLLLLLAFPFLLSFTSTLLLFTPGFDSLVSMHCHDDCAAHMPLIATPGMAPLGLLLISTIVALTGHRLWLNLRTSKRLKAQLRQLATHEKDYELLGNEQPFVFTLGWWSNEIYVTEGLRKRCTEQDMDVILAHEQAHSRRFDNVRLLSAVLFTLVLPKRLARALLNDLHLLVESACDFEAASRFGDLDVAETLLKVQKLSPAQWQCGSQVIFSAFTGAEIQQRVKSLVHGRQRSLMQQAGLQLSLMMLVVASVGLVEPLHHGVEVVLGLP